MQKVPEKKAEPKKKEKDKINDLYADIDALMKDEDDAKSGSEDNDDQDYEADFKGGTRDDIDDEKVLAMQ